MESTENLLLWILATWVVSNIILGFIGVFYESSRDLETQIRKRLNEIIHCVRVEKHNDTYYWYDDDDNRFLAQGSTSEEIVDHLKARFPDHIFVVSDHFIAAGTDWKPIATPDKSLFKN